MREEEHEVDDLHLHFLAHTDNAPEFEASIRDYTAKFNNSNSRRGTHHLKIKFAALQQRNLSSSSIGITAARRRPITRT